MSPSSPPFPPHGGDLAAAEKIFGRPRSGWLDLSTGINADAYPDTAISPAALKSLPQPAMLGALLSAARARYRVPEDAGLVAAPGCQAILQWLPRLRPESRVAIVGPTYSEYGRTWSAAGHAVRDVRDLDDAGSADVIVLANPNNPDGRRHPPQRLARLADDLAGRGGWLIVDEAFADTTPDLSLAPRSNRAGVIVLRSFGKFFGLAGLRLGFAAAPRALANALQAGLGPWAVPGPALEIGVRALCDGDWAESAARRLRTHGRALDALLSRAGLKVLGGTDLFRLVECADAESVYRRLGRAGILVRRFPDHPRWLRFGLPGDESDFQRLEEALSGSLATRSTR